MEEKTFSELPGFRVVSRKHKHRYSAVQRTKPQYSALMAARVAERGPVRIGPRIRVHESLASFRLEQSVHPAMALAGKPEWRGRGLR